MKTRKLTITLLAIAVVGLALFNLFSGGDGDGPPLRDAQELAALPDDQLEGAVLTELGRDAYREGAAPDAWRGLNRQARHLWSVAAIRDLDPAILADWLAMARNGLTTPGPEDMAAGLGAMGLAEAQAAMEELATKRDAEQGELRTLHGRLLKALGDPAARTTRQAWVRENLAGLMAR